MKSMIIFSILSLSSMASAETCSKVVGLQKSLNASGVYAKLENGVKLGVGEADYALLVSTAISTGKPICYEEKRIYEGREYPAVSSEGFIIGNMTSLSLKL